MARSASDTREKLISVGSKLFADSGVFQVPLRTVIEQAGQKNTSALHYHFGGRDGLLQAIIERHNSSIEAEREHMLAEIRDNDRIGDVRALVTAVVVPFARKLETPEGREFLRVVAQLSELFDAWEQPGPKTPEQAQTAFFMLASALDLSPPMRHERVTTFLMLVCDALALRARQIDRGRSLNVDDDGFVANLIDMCVGAVQAASVSVSVGANSSGATHAAR